MTESFTSSLELGKDLAKSLRLNNRVLRRILSEAPSNVIICVACNRVTMWGVQELKAHQNWAPTRIYIHTSESNVSLIV